MKKILPLTLVLLLLIGWSKSDAQIAFGYNYHMQIPLDSYKENLHTNPQGFLVSALVKSKKVKNLYIGGDFGVSMYADDEYFYELPDGEFAGEIVEMYEEDCFISYNAIVRYNLIEEAKLSPYLQASIGGLSFFSTRMSTDETVEYYESITRFHGTSLVGGIGAGLQYKVHSQVRIDAGAFYNRGTQAHYRSIEPGSASLRRSLDYGQYESNLSSLSIKIGILCGF